jgi:23S rRNA (cytidine1920-2'-O)/16S rRNA (cytidine1409-2'-O)-methyltransferase
MCCSRAARGASMPWTSGARSFMRGCGEIRRWYRLRRPISADFVTVDVSFISLKLVLPELDRLVCRPAQLIALIKPQFEAGRTHLKKGIVRNAAVRAAVCDEISIFAAALGWTVAGVTPSPIQGGEGNREFLLGARRV